MPELKEAEPKESESKMSKSKKIILLAFISALLVWPPIHMGLSIHHGFSSWKFAGWGMYAAPRLTPVIEVAVDNGAGRFTWLSPGSLQRHAVWGKWVRLVRTRRALGRLSPPDPLADALFASDSHIARVRIRISQPRIDRRTAMLDSETETFDFERH